MGSPALGDRRIDLDRPPSPAGRERVGGGGDGVDVAPERRPQLDEVVLRVRFPGRGGAFLDGRDAERPQRVARQLGLAGRDGDDEGQHQSTRRSVRRKRVGAVDVGLHGTEDVVEPRSTGLDRRRCPDGERTWWHVDVRQHDGVGGDDRTGADDAAVQHDGAVGDHRPVLDRAALEVHDVADHALVADHRRIVERRVQRRCRPGCSCGHRCGSPRRRREARRWATPSSRGPMRTEPMTTASGWT